ncbi:MAG: flavodoxin-dependent (E)-4-hydroxy-3-methylbut-2-enyl-diphosphate synthase [Clostridiales bacterium]|nr:flavodoxin-dependent (E)-4-hydroxy-3-methylbut-2-enyl-diphosphate synthase [Clostridiales bacterium]
MTSMSKKVSIGNVIIGGGERVAVQSMATFKISDTARAIDECQRLKSLGLDIMRFSVTDELDAKAFGIVKKGAGVPLVADIHFDYKLALASIDGGADKIRINPGNIGGEQNVKAVADALKANKIPVRVGSNTGSIEKEFLRKYGKNEISLGESALKNVAILEKHGVDNIVISVKASDVSLMVKAYEYIAKKTDYPLHLGVTEAGTEYSGVVKNSIGIGALLLKGIGDTLRVSLSADTAREVIAAREILSAVNLIDDKVKIIACPTCGRCEWDCMNFAKKVEDYTQNIKKPLKIAVMGCVVNGPGEAADADLGIAGGKDECVIFVKGKIVKKVKKDQVEKVFFGEIDRCLQ